MLSIDDVKRTERCTDKAISEFTKTYAKIVCNRSRVAVESKRKTEKNNNRSRKKVMNEEKQALPRPCAMYALFAKNKYRDFMIGILVFFIHHFGTKIRGNFLTVAFFSLSLESGFCCTYVFS